MAACTTNTNRIKSRVFPWWRLTNKVRENHICACLRWTWYWLQHNHICIMSKAQTIRTIWTDRTAKHYVDPAHLIHGESMQEKKVRSKQYNSSCALREAKPAIISFPNSLMNRRLLADLKANHGNHAISHFMLFFDNPAAVVIADWPSKDQLFLIKFGPQQDIEQQSIIFFDISFETTFLSVEWQASHPSSFEWYHSHRQQLHLLTISH